MAVVFRSSEEQATTSWYPLGGYSIMYLFTESFLLASPWRPGDSQKAVAIVYLVVKIFRLLFIALLVAVTVGSCLVPKRCQPGDEETLPLLRDDGGQGTQRCYNTIPNGTEPQGQNSDSQGTEASKEPNNTVKVCHVNELQ